jgi:hypothetical protein
MTNVQPVVVSAPEDFAAAVRAHRFREFAFDGGAVALARASLAEAGLLVVGEPHGVYETPGVLYSLACALDTRAVAFEWSHEEMNETVQSFLVSGSFHFDRLWSLPESAEFFWGDGRIAAGHFALLQRLRDEGRLDQVIVFDRLDPESPDPVVRDREMAQRLLAEWDDAAPLLVLIGAFHAQLEADEGETTTTHLARHRPGLRPAMLDYSGGQCWSRELHDVSGPILPAPIRLRLPEATPAVVPGTP